MPHFLRTPVAVAVTATAALGAIAVTATVPASAADRPAQAVGQSDQTSDRAPSAPESLRAIATGPHTVLLSWSPSTDDGEIAIYHIDLVRPDGSLAAAGNTLTATSFTVRRLTADSEYAFQVVAIDGSENFSAPSTVVEVRTPAS